MALLNFTDALQEAKRRAQLQGRPISTQEVSGIAKGYAENAADKAYQEKQLGIQEKGLTESSRQFTEQLAQRKYETELERKAAEEAKETEKMEKIASGVAGVAGGVAGGIIGSGVPGVGTYAGAMGGAAIGAAVGPGMYQADPLKPVAKGLFGGCIIISSCTSSNSYEVQIAREYRDKFMSEFSLTGYYLLCMVIVPTIIKSTRFKLAVKRILVDRLVDFGECAMGYKPKRKLWTSYAITKSFLVLCRLMGKGANMILEAQHAK